MIFYYLLLLFLIPFHWFNKQTVALLVNMRWSESVYVFSKEILSED